jgi:hypothetical protein
MKKSTCTFPLPQEQSNRVKQKSMAVHYGEWLNTMEWDFFCTFTTSYSLSKNAAINSMGRLKNHLSMQNGCEPTIFYVAEPFDSKYGYHLHALMKDNCKPGLERVSLIKEAWQRVSKGKYGKANKFTKIVPYDRNLGGNYYVAKYLHRYNAEYGFA